MSYAIRDDGQGWRAVGGPEDVGLGEHYSEDMPGPTAPSVNQETIRKIENLEATVTDRRLREAVLGIDDGWLKALDDQVAALRAMLPL